MDKKLEVGISICIIIAGYLFILINPYMDLRDIVPSYTSLNIEGENIIINESYESITIDNPEKEFVLFINGKENKIKITERTRLKNIILTGPKNIITLCEDSGIDSIKFSKEGESTIFKYIEC